MIKLKNTVEANKHKQNSLSFHETEGGREVAKQLREELARLELPRNAKVIVTCLTDAVHKDSEIVVRLIVHGKLSAKENKELEMKLGYNVVDFIKKLRRS